MLGSVFRSALPDAAIEYAGFVLVHCAAIADANREGELICPFAVFSDTNGREVVDLVSDTQEEAIAKGWASLQQARDRRLWWAFGREGIYRESDGTGTDVLTVSVWLPGMKHHHSFSQRFGRGPDNGIYLIGSTEAFKHETERAESLAGWNELALARGISSHRQGDRWSQWRTQ